MRHAEQLRHARLQRATEESKREKETFQITDSHGIGGDDIYPDTEIEECVHHRYSEAFVAADSCTDDKAIDDIGEEENEDAFLEQTEWQQSNGTPIRSEFPNEKNFLYGTDKKTGAENKREPLDDYNDCVGLCATSSDNNDLNDSFGLESYNDNVGFREHYGIAERDASSSRMGEDTYQKTESVAMERLIQDSLALLQDEKVNGRKVNSAYAARNTWGDDSSDDVSLPDMLELLRKDVPTTIRSEPMAEVNRNLLVSKSKCVAMEGNQEDVLEIPANGCTTTSSIVHRVYKDNNGKQLSWEELEALPPKNSLSIFSNLPQAVVGIDDNNDELDDGEVVLSTADMRNHMLARLVAS